MAISYTHNLDNFLRISRMKAVLHINAYKKYDMAKQMTVYHTVDREMEIPVCYDTE